MSSEASSSPSPTSTPWQLQARVLGLQQGQTAIKVSTTASNHAPQSSSLLTCYAGGGADGGMGAKVAVSSHGHSAPSSDLAATVLPINTFSGHTATFELQLGWAQKTADKGC